MELSQEELQMIIDKRENEKSQVQLKKEGEQKSGLYWYKKELVEVENKFNLTSRKFGLLEKTLDGKFKGLFKLQKFVQTVKIRNQYVEFFSQEELQSYEVQLRRCVITFDYKYPTGEVKQLEISTSSTKSGNPTFEIPYNLNTSTKYYNFLVVKSFIKRMTEEIERSQNIYNENVKFNFEYKNLVKQFKSESPEGTKLSTSLKTKYPRYGGSYTLNLLHIEYPNGNSLVLSVSKNMSYTLVEKVDVTTSNFKTKDWIDYLKK